MRSVIVALLVWSGTTAAAVEPARSIVLVEDGRSPYVIVLAAEASPSEQHAARDLGHSLGGATGVEVPIVTEGQASALSARSVEAGERTDIVIAGGRQRGTM